jgi:hypothetical protein
VLVTRLSLKVHTIVALDPSVIILQAKRVGTQMMVLLVQHVHHPIGSAKYDDFKFSLNVYKMKVKANFLMLKNFHYISF